MNKDNWNYIIIICLIGLCILFWNMNQRNLSKIVQITNQLNIQEDIKQTEARLKEIRDREEQYKLLLSKQTILIKSLNELDIKQKELEKRKKETIINEIKNFTQDDIKSALSNIGISSTIISTK